MYRSNYHNYISRNLNAKFKVSTQRKKLYLQGDARKSVRLCPWRANLWILPVHYIHLWKIRAPLRQIEGFNMHHFDAVIDKVPVNNLLPYQIKNGFLARLLVIWCQVFFFLITVFLLSPNEHTPCKITGSDR
jgi:hypothetical protein